MPQSDRVRKKFSEFCTRLTQIPELNVNCNVSECSSDIFVENHMPLEKFSIALFSKKYFWSANYDLVWTVNGNFRHSDFVIALSGKNNFAAVSGDAEKYAETLNSNPLISARVSALDFTSFRITCKDGILSISCSALPGSITSMLIPPLTYQIPISLNEVILIIELLQLTKSAFNQSL